MVKKKFECRNCGHKFEFTVLQSREEDIEWMRKNPGKRLSPRVICPKCGSVDVIET